MLPAGASVQEWASWLGVCPCVRGSFAHMGAGVRACASALGVCTCVQMETDPTLLPGIPLLNWEPRRVRWAPDPRPRLLSYPWCGLPPSSCEEALSSWPLSVWAPCSSFPMHSQPDPVLEPIVSSLAIRGRNPQLQLYSEKLPWY